MPEGSPASVPGGSVGSEGVTVRRDGDVCRVAGVIDFSSARATLERVEPLVARGEVRRIDLGGVTRSNSAGLALMIEWLAAARREGRPLEFVAVPEGLRQLAAVCQVDELIGAARGPSVPPAPL